MAKATAFYAFCADVGRRIVKAAYRSIGPVLSECRAVELSAATLVDAAYSDAIYYYPWLYPFYIIHIKKNNNKKEADILTAKGATYAGAVIIAESEIDGCGVLVDSAIRRLKLSMCP